MAEVEEKEAVALAGAAAAAEERQEEAEIKSETANGAEKKGGEEEGKEKESKGRVAEMKPWEQHAGVISIPRFDYNASSILLQRSVSGFLVTCPIKREKSATKEAISILQKYVEPCKNGNGECFQRSDEMKSIKRRKIEDEGERGESTVEDIGASSEDECVCLPTNDETKVAGGFALSLVKLTRSGLLLLAFLDEKSPDTSDIVSNIFQYVESGSLKSPLWCHRIFPIQATCLLNEKELRAVVSGLVRHFMKDKENNFARPVKFAVGYNRRGLEETLKKNEQDNSKDSELHSLLERGKCFDVVASAVKDVISDSTVDLKSPDFSVLVELLPLSGVPNGSLVAAVSVLPLNLVSTKPRLCIKPLVSDANAKKGKLER